MSLTTRDILAEIAEFALAMQMEIGQCACSEPYTNIGRRDPECTFHRVWGADEDGPKQLAELLSQIGVVAK